jgi:glycosyltransferase involved in cell wall biosynthesis
MTVCYFGGYNPNNSRNRIILKALRSGGVQVLECRDVSVFPINLIKLFLKHRNIRKKYDVMLIGFSGQGMTFFAKLLTRKPIILDAFISLYNTVIEDRKLHSRFSISALYNYFLDWGSIRLADRVLLDTHEHIKYFVKKFKISESKFSVVPVGTDEEIFYPRPEPQNDKFIVGFHGTYIPLHGVGYIIKAAEILKNDKDIEFRLLGNGQTLEETKRSVKKMGLENVRFYEERVPYEKLPEFIAGNDICLGIFGDTIKAKMVIPNKIYECAAMEKAIITEDTPAIREYFSDDDIKLIDIDNPKNLADMILELKEKPELRIQMANNAYNKFKTLGTVKMIGQKLLKDIHSLLFIS